MWYTLTTPLPQRIWMCHPRCDVAIIFIDRYWPASGRYLEPNFFVWSERLRYNFSSSFLVKISSLLKFCPIWNFPTDFGSRYHPGEPSAIGKTCIFAEKTCKYKHFWWCDFCLKNFLYSSQALGLYVVIRNTRIVFWNRILYARKKEKIWNGLRKHYSLLALRT